jgi:hypothetical protein
MRVPEEVQRAEECEVRKGEGHWDIVKRFQTVRKHIATDSLTRILCIKTLG